MLGWPRPRRAAIEETIKRNKKARNHAKEEGREGGEVSYDNTTMDASTTHLHNEWKTAGRGVEGMPGRVRSEWGKGGSVGAATVTSKKVRMNERTKKGES